MCRASTVLFLLACLGSVDPARAAELQLRGDTLLSASGTRPALGAADVRSRVPLYQFLQAHADLGLEGLEVELAGVGLVHLGPPPLVEPGREGSRADGLLQVGLVRWRHEKHGITLSLGRQYLFAGAGQAEHLDGLAASFRLPGNVDLSCFGGRTAPWQVDGELLSDEEPWALSNWAVGGRARFRLLEQAVASVGFLHEGHDGEIVRQSLALDAGWWRSRYLEALAGGTLSTTEWLPQEVWVQLISRPADRLKLTLDYSYQVPSLTIPRTSIFSVFTLDSFQEIAAGAHYGLTPRLSLGLEGGARLLPAADGLRLGYSAAGSVRLALGEGAARLAGARAEILEADGERLIQGRLHALYTLACGLHASAELFLLHVSSSRGAAGSIFERRTAEHPWSVGGLGLVGYHFTERLSLALSGSAYLTPLAGTDLRLLSRLTYAGQWGGSR